MFLTRHGAAGRVVLDHIGSVPSRVEVLPLDDAQLVLLLLWPGRVQGPVVPQPDRAGVYLGKSPARGIGGRLPQRRHGSLSKLFRDNKGAKAD